MPINRERRNALAELLLQTLRGEHTHHEFWNRASALFAPPLPSHPRSRTHPGFPVLTPHPEEPEPPPTPVFIHDEILNDHLRPLLFETLGNLWSRNPAHQRTAYTLLAQTLTLLHSDLEVTALPPPLKRRALHPLLLAIIAGLTLVLSIAAGIIHPFFFLLWPTVGAFLSWQLQIFRPPGRTTQIKPIIQALPPSPEAPPFNPAHFPSPNPARGKQLLACTSAFTFTAIAAIAIALIFTLAWPLILRDAWKKSHLTGLR